MTEVTCEYMQHPLISIQEEIKLPNQPCKPCKCALLGNMLGFFSLYLMAVGCHKPIIDMYHVIYICLIMSIFLFTIIHFG